MGPPADLYALGCILFEMLAGHPPYEAKSVLDMLRQHMQAPVPVVNERRQDVPDDLAHLLFCLLAKDPSDRPATAGEVRQLLLPFASSSTADGAGAPSEHLASLGHFERAAAAELPKQLSPSDVDELRARAQELAEAERFTQAAELLERALKPAMEGGDAVAPVVVALRKDLADLYALAGDYQGAGSSLEALAHALEAAGADPGEVHRYRQEAAAWLAELG